MGYPVKKVSAKIIDRTLKTTGLNAADLAFELGISPGAIPDWRRRKECPAYIGVACKAIVQKYKPNSGEIVIWVKVSDDQKEFMTDLLDRMGAKYGSVSDL